MARRFFQFSVGDNNKCTSICLTTGEFMGGGDFDKSEKISISDLDVELGNNSKFPDLVQQGLELKNFQTLEIPSADESNQMIQEFWQSRFPNMFQNVSNLIQNAASLGFNYVEYWYCQNEVRGRKGPYLQKRIARQKFERLAARYIEETLLPSKGYKISNSGWNPRSKSQIQKNSFRIINNVDFDDSEGGRRTNMIQVRW